MRIIKDKITKDRINSYYLSLLVAMITNTIRIIIIILKGERMWKGSPQNKNNNNNNNSNNKYIW